MLCQLVGSVVKKLRNVQNLKFGALSGFLLLSTVVLGIGYENENSVSAQNSTSITPDLKIFFSDAIFPNSYSRADFADVDDRSLGSKGGSDAQSTTTAEDETINAPKVDETTSAHEVDETTTATEVDETTTATEEKMQEAEKRANEALFESAIFGLDISFD
jgi:hypothetical protein